MKKKILIASLFSSILISTISFAQPTNKSSDAPYSTKQLNYTASGSAEVTIQRPINDVFNILTDVNRWPQINQGVTQAIQPAHIQVKRGTVFKESIASPIPGIENWTNEWHVVEFEKNKKFIIAGIEQFAQVPIHSKITYEFEAINRNTTEFERTIEVTLDDKFIQGSTKAEVEALYRFLGSQWEMANHLKQYIEKQ